MTAHHGRDPGVALLFSFAAPAYDFSYLQRWLYRPAQDEMVALLGGDGCHTIADIACGTGILADRIERELQPDAVYGVDLSEGCSPEPEHGRQGSPGSPAPPSDFPSPTVRSTPW
jgi:ubiquinone/menaquinone biosynthesis C-methylase UbiE